MPHTTPDLPATLQVPVQARVDFVRFAYGDRLVLAGMRDGTVGVWRLQNLVAGNASHQTNLPVTNPILTSFSLSANPPSSFPRRPRLSTTSSRTQTANPPASSFLPSTPSPSSMSKPTPTSSLTLRTSNRPPRAGASRARASRSAPALAPSSSSPPRARGGRKSPSRDHSRAHGRSGPSTGSRTPSGSQRTPARLHLDSRSTTTTKSSSSPRTRTSPSRTPSSTTRLRALGWRRAKVVAGSLASRTGAFAFWCPPTLLY